MPDLLILQTQDLFFIPTVKSVAEAKALDTMVVPNGDSKRLETVDSHAVRIYLIDLTNVGLSALDDLLPGLRAKFPRAQLVAFGPHVHVAKLQRARDGGCDEVLSRGQLSTQLSERMERWLEAP